MGTSRKFVSPAGNRWIILDKLDESVYSTGVPYLLKQYEQGKEQPQELRISKDEADKIIETMLDNGWIRA